MTQPTDTPPGEGSTGGLGRDEAERSAEPNIGPVTPSRAPAVVAMVFIVVIVVGVLGYVLAGLIGVLD